MNTTDERMLILRMIEDGKVSAEEGAKLLASIGQEPTARPNLPIGLMDWGLKVGAQFAPEMDGIDLNELSEILKSGADGKIVEVIDEEDGEHVEIYIE